VRSNLREAVPPESQGAVSLIIIHIIKFKTKW